MRYTKRVSRDEASAEYKVSAIASFIFGAILLLVGIFNLVIGEGEIGAAFIGFSCLFGLNGYGKLKKSNEIWKVDIPEFREIVNNSSTSVKQPEELHKTVMDRIAAADSSEKDDPNHGRYGSSQIMKSGALQEKRIGSEQSWRCPNCEKTDNDTDVCVICGYWKCRDCGNISSKDSLICLVCGSWKCPNCENICSKDTDTCMNCGYKSLKMEADPPQKKRDVKKTWMWILAGTTVTALLTFVILIAVSDNSAGITDITKSNDMVQETIAPAGSGPEQETGPTIEEQYLEAVDYYHYGHYSKCMTSFEQFGDFHEAEKYRNLIHARYIDIFYPQTEPDIDALVKRLTEQIGFEDTTEVLVCNDTIGQAFLRGFWSTSNGMYTFEMGDNGSFTTTLPVVPQSGTSYSIRDGVLWRYFDGKSNEETKNFTLKPLTSTEMEIYAYQVNKTYTLMKRR